MATNRANEPKPTTYVDNEEVKWSYVRGIIWAYREKAQVSYLC